MFSNFVYSVYEQPFAMSWRMFMNKMNSFKIIYERFIKDARTILKDDGYMVAMEKIFMTKIKQNVQRLYINAPSYYSSITQNQEIFDFLMG